jgi:hypothetical protein
MKTLTAAFTSALLLSSFLFSMASAAVPSTGRQFEATILKAQKSCPSLRCARQLIQIRPLSALELSRLDAQTKAALIQSMGSVADIWPDTILEGGYETDFQLRIDQVELVQINRQPIGFRFTFSAAARDEGRRIGRIVESAFLSQDLTTSFRDEMDLAHFQVSAR